MCKIFCKSIKLTSLFIWKQHVRFVDRMLKCMRCCVVTRPIKRTWRWFLISVLHHSAFWHSCRSRVVNISTLCEEHLVLPREQGGLSNKAYLLCSWFGPKNMVASCLERAHLKTRTLATLNPFTEGRGTWTFSRIWDEIFLDDTSEQVPLIVKLLTELITIAWFVLKNWISLRIECKRTLASQSTSSYKCKHLTSIWPLLEFVSNNCRVSSSEWYMEKTYFTPGALLF